MRCNGLILALLLTPCCCGCVLTSEPIGAPADRVFDDALLGAWEPDPQSSYIAPRGKVVVQRKENGYSFEVRDPKGVVVIGKGEFFLFKLGDAYLVEQKVGNRFFAMRIALVGPRLRYYPLAPPSEKRAKEYPKLTMKWENSDALSPLLDLTGREAKQSSSGMRLLVLEGSTRDLRPLFVQEAGTPVFFSDLKGMGASLRRANAEKVLAEGLASKRQRTYEMWPEVLAFVRVPSSLDNFDANYFTGADEDVLDLLKDLKRLAERVAALDEQRRRESPGTWPGVYFHFDRGFRGKRYASVEDIPDDREAWQLGVRMGKLARERLAEVRMVLNQRYGLELPAP
jgi:hypothetical protein